MASIEISDELDHLSVEHGPATKKAESGE